MNDMDADDIDLRPPSPGLRVEFCGEWIDVPIDRPWVIGRGADYEIDDNAYLHRRFVALRRNEGLWWLSNIGSQLAATLSDDAGRFQAWLAPGAHLPLVFDGMVLRFTAGPTSYELCLRLEDPPFTTTTDAVDPDTGTTTLGRVFLTPEQRLLVAALAEPALRRSGTGRSELPSSAAAAQRLGWALTKFNRKLDNVCQKLKRAGIRGLHGGPERLASDRRVRLVEYALAVRLVTIEDLTLLDEAAQGT